MDAMTHRWQRFILAPSGVDSEGDFRDRWTVRNATCLIGALSSFMGAVVFALIGSAELYIPAVLVGVGFLVAFELSRRGHRRAACLLAIVPLELALFYNTHNFGAGLFESAYLMCVCIAYLLLESDDASVLMGVIALTTALVAIGCFAWDEPTIALTLEQRNILLAATVCLTLSNMATVLFYFLGTRRRASSRLRAALTEANAANAAKSEFLASMSHEIRTPMNGVIGMLSVLEQTELNDRQRDFLDTAQLSSRALVDIINDILDLSKVEAGQLKLEHQPFSLRALVETSARLAAVQARSAHLDVVVDYPPEVPAGVIGDAGRIRQIISNLLSNALKFTERGHISLAVECIARTDRRATLEISVTDTGVGIPEAQQPTIFDKFKQVEGGSHTGHGGTGLGLAIVRELVALMGGSVAVSSSPGQGARFCCQVPLELHPVAEEEATALAAGDEMRAGGAARRALIVDGQALRIADLCAWLEHWQVASARCSALDEASAFLARARAHGHEYDFLFLGPDATAREWAAWSPELAAMDGAQPALRVVVVTDVACDSEPSALAEEPAPGPMRLTLPLRHAELAHLLAQPAATTNAAEDSETERGGALRCREWPDELRVLVVDDNPINQKVARRMLENLACRVDVASSGREALGALAQTFYELVFMDVQMPDMDGIEATGLIRAGTGANARTDGAGPGRPGDSASDVPIVAMTAHAMDGSRARCLAAGMDGFVSKPVEQRDLAAVLERFSARLAANRQTATHR